MARAKTAGNISKDSYHSAILVALDEHIDDQAFEACAVDLLNQIYPNLVPMRGGSDDGYDGVIYSESGPPVPLISTTGTDAKGNLKRNLTRACAREPKPVLAVFATTRRITPQRRKNLTTAALEIAGVALRIYEREWFANALYRNGAWAKKLLGVTGQPSALSTSPLSSRPLLGGQLIGRDDELNRLRGITSDVLVIAEPGAGKTFLLSELAREKRALFLADSNPEALANAIRSQKPTAIILDDAHIWPEMLTKLRHLRTEVGAKFHIIAVGWPGESSSLQTLLGITSDNVIALPGIDADTMVKIIQSVGIHGPRDLIHSIVRQAEGRAGLATTLADLCLRGDHREVWSGQSLTRDLLHMLRQLVGEDPAPLLACFSLAGATGFKSEVVARFLGKPLDQISSLLARLGSAGVIRTNERSDGVSVWPDLLRWNLVRDVFFVGAGRLSPDELLNQSPSIDQTVLTLVGAKSRGAPIPNLEQWLERSHSADLWGGYASLGRSEARHVIQSRPALIVELSWQLLNARPEETIPFLLDAAVGDDRPLHANPGHPLRRLESWIEHPVNRVQSRVWRTTTLLTAIERWWKTKGVDTLRFGNVAIHAFAIAFKPNWLFTETDPGKGNTMSWGQGSVTEKECDEFRTLWRERCGMLGAGQHVAWRHVISMAHEWMHSPPNARLSTTHHARRREVAKQIIKDLWNTAQEHAGARHQIQSMAERLNVSIEPKPPSDFDTLFPSERDFSRHQEQSERWAREARALAQKWMEKGPTESAARIVEMERRAAEVSITWPRLTPVLFDEIARQTTTPALWLASLSAVSASPDLLAPFLRRLSELADEKADAAVRQCLNENKYLGLGIEAALTLPMATASTVKLAIARADDAPGLLRTLALCENLSPDRLREVLASGSAAVVFATALGEWQAAKQVNRAVHHPDIWREAILRSADLTDIDNGTEFELGEIFKSQQPVLAFQWLQRLCKRPDDYLPYHLSEAAGHAKAALQPADRHAFIKQTSPIPLLSELALGVVSTDLDAYRALLNRPDLAEFHLKPLEVYLSSPAWRSKAVVALDFGYSTDQIVDITGPRGWFWSGPRSEMWKKLKSEADIFLNDTDPRIAAIANELSRKYESLLQERLEEERQEAIVGRRR